MDYHKANFTRLAEKLEGIVDEVVVSFVQLYRKTLRNFAKASASGLTWSDPADNYKLSFISELTVIASQHAINFNVCLRWTPLLRQHEG